VAQDHECFELLLSIFERCFCEKMLKTDAADRIFVSREALKCPYYDLIVPAFGRSEFGSEELRCLSALGKAGWQPSLYLSARHHPALVAQFSPTQRTEMKHLVRVPTSVTDERAELELLDEETFSLAVSYLDRSFPEYTDNRNYLSALCTHSGRPVQHIHTFGLVDSRRVSFASAAVIEGCAYIHNFCVLPEHRGRGVFGKHKSALLALLSEREVPLALSLNSPDRASLSVNKKLGGSVADTVYHVPLR
jgi:GNAT superfamily N-acetyltransferase